MTPEKPESEAKKFGQSTKGATGSDAAADRTRPATLVVEFKGRQSRRRIKALRKGKGSLMRKVDGLIDELVADGTMKPDAQPVVVVVRQEAEAWSLCGL